MMEGDATKPSVVVYTDRLLPGSATFIRRQAQAVQGYRIYYVGTKLDSGLELPDDRTVVINAGGPIGRAQEILFKLTGISPAFKRRLATLSPVLVHAHFGPDGLAAIPLADHLGVPLLVTFQGYGATTYDAYAEKSFYRHRKYVRHRERLISRADGFLAVSKFIKTCLVAQGFPPEEIRVHYTGIDTSDFRPDPEEPDERVVLFVGRLVEKKGVGYLIRAMQEVQRRHSDVVLVVIGDGEGMQDYRREAERRLRSVQFLGFRTQYEVRRWMRRALMIAVPSVRAESGDAEGLPNVVLEAMASGLPVVGTRHAGIPEAVEEGETGLLCEEHDSRGLATNISTLLENSELRRQMARSSRERAVDRFDLKQQTRRLERIYAQMIEEVGRSK